MADSSTHAASLYPLDKNRKLLSERTDDKGTVYKLFRLFSEDGDYVDVEYEIHHPQKPATLKPSKHTIVGQEANEEGSLKTLKIRDQSGAVKDYHHVDSHEQVNGKRKAENQQQDSKKSKSEATASDQFPINWHFTELLLKTRVEQVNQVAQGKIFVAYRHELAKDVFRGLVEHGFYSCPVLNKKGNVHYGFIDLLDFVHYFIGEIAGKELRGPGTDLWSMLTQVSTFSDKKVKDMMVSPHRVHNPSHPIHKGYSLYAAVEALAKEKHLHRVPIIDDNRSLVNLITQSQIIDFVYANINTIGSRKDKLLSQIPALFHTVERILVDQQVIEAFKIIELKGVTGVAVVDAQDKLVGAVSGRDLKGIDIDGKWLSRLFLTGDAYFGELLTSYPETQRPSGPIFVTPNDTLETVIRKIHDYKIHRVFICDEKRRPVGVVGLKEICRELVY